MFSSFFAFPVNKFRDCARKFPAGLSKLHKRCLDKDSRKYAVEKKSKTPISLALWAEIFGISEAFFGMAVRSSFYVFEWTFWKFFFQKILFHSCLVFVRKFAGIVVKSAFWTCWSVQSKEEAFQKMYNSFISLDFGKNLWQVFWELTSTSPEEHLTEKFRQKSSIDFYSDLEWRSPASRQKLSGNFVKSAFYMSRGSVWRSFHPGATLDL